MEQINTFIARSGYIQLSEIPQGSTHIEREKRYTLIRTSKFRLRLGVLNFFLKLFLINIGKIWSSSMVLKFYLVLLILRLVLLLVCS